jgi:hypothetical protein
MLDYTTAERRATATRRVVTVRDTPRPTQPQYAHLCWKRQPGKMARCVFLKGHAGPHGWEGK